MSQDLMINEAGGALALPAHLQGVDTGVTKALLAGMFVGGNRIGLKGSRFRLMVAGQEEGVIEENYLDTILLNAAPAVSRAFYKKAYVAGENAAPTCYSADGIAPPNDVREKQSDKCATCPQNVKGSKTDGGQKYKACGYFRRLVLMLAGDVEDRRIFKLDAKSGSLWGDGTASAKNLNDYIKSLTTRGVDVGQVVTRMTFDLNSDVPKLLFRPHRYITPEELQAVQDLIHSDEVKQLAIVNMSTVDLSGEEPSSGDTPEQEPAQAAPQTPSRPQTAAKPAPQRPAQAATTQVEDVPVQVQQTTQAVQRPAARPAQTVTRPAPQQPPVVESDADLASILEGLE